MRKTRFETGRTAVKILAILSVCTCFASLMAGEGTALQFWLAVVTLLLFVSIFAVLLTFCRCPYCGKAIYFGVWQKTVCPHCSRNLNSGKKVKGNKR